MKPLDPRLLRYSRSSRGFFVASLLISIGIAFTTVLQAFLISSEVVAIFQNHHNPQLLDKKLVQLIFVFCIRAFLNYLSERISVLASTHIRSEIRTSLLKKSLGNNSSVSNEFGPAQLSILATTGVNSLDSYFSKFLPQLFIAAVVPLFVGVIIAITDLRSGFIVLFTLPLIPLFGILIGRFTAAEISKKWQTMGILSGYFMDLLNGLTTLKVYGREKKQEERILSVGDSYRKQTIKVLRISFLSSLALELIATLSVALIAVSIGLRLVNGSLSLLTGLFVLILAPEVYWPVRQVATFFHSAVDGLEVFEKVYSILGAKVNDGEITVKRIDAITWGELAISYPNRTNINIPAGQLRKGEVHAVNGISGSGKSSLVNAILGFTTPDSGEILVSTDQGTYPLTELDLASYRQHVAWMPQEPKFPLGTIKQILLHAKPGASNSDIEKVLQDADLNYENLPDGISTILGTVNQPLSTGQLRKIALARAILKNAQVLIVDEPTASIDDVSEKLINELLHREAQSGKLVLLVSHRPLLTISADVSTDLMRPMRSARMV